MPAVRRAGAAVALHVSLLLRGGKRGPFARVEADHNDLVFLACVELQLLRGLQHTSEHERAKVRTLIISERENHRSLAEEMPKRHGATKFVAKNGIQRHAGV